MGKDYNRAAALLEFSKGATLEEISHALAIPIDYLKRWSHNEAWESIVPQMRAVAVTTPSSTAIKDAERARELIKQNRERNLVIAQKLQEDLLDVVQQLRDGKLRAKRVFANGLQIEVDPTLRDRCDLALYAKNVADMSYRALGDQESAKNPHAEGGLPSAGQITIILPPLLAAPREKTAEITEITAIVTPES